MPFLALFFFFFFSVISILHFTIYLCLFLQFFFDLILTVILECKGQEIIGDYIDYRLIENYGDDGCK